MKKNLLSMVLLLLSMVASAHDFEVGGIYYNIINENEVAVTFKGSDPNGNYGIYTGHVSIPTIVTYNNTTYSVTVIGDYAFMNSFGMTSIEIPNSVTTIGNHAFASCHGLTSIVIPNSVTSIGDAGLSMNTGLTSISVESGNAVYDSRDNCNAIIKTSSNTLITGCKNTIIPNSVTSIGEQAFLSCNGLTSVLIPNSVTSIGSRALAGCTGLTSLSVESGNAVYDSRDNCNAIIKTSSNTLITGCKNTIIPNSVTSIGDYAFEHSRELTSIVIPNSVTSIGIDAFSNCSGLTNIVIPNSVTNIGKGALVGCTGLTSIVIPNSITRISNNVFFCCSGLTNIVIPNSVTSIGIGAFEFCSGLTNIVIPNSVTSIDIGAFYGCSELTCIEFGNSVTNIGEKALSQCGSLTDIYCYSQNPPTCFDNTSDTYTATLHVPATSIAAYFTASYWSNFENIIGDAVVPTGISISNDSINLQPGEQATLMATVTPQNASNKEITWISTDTTVATVNNGVVHAVGCGECDIIASCFGMQAVCHVSVAIRITLDQQEAMLLPNHMLTLTPIPTAPGIYAVSSSEPTVAAARILSSGLVQVVGIKEGTTTITVSSVDGTAVPATCLITVYTETGDMNSDGFVNISDVTSLINYLLSGDGSQISTKNADVNGDNKIGISDVTALINKLLRSTE